MTRESASPGLGVLVVFVASVEVHNFRSILSERLSVGALTALVGANGSGKSAFLRAIELFYATAPRFDAEDYYGGDTTRDIEITLTFEDLSPEARSRFQPYLEAGKLSVTRVLSLASGRPVAKYHGVSLQHEPFADIRRTEAAREAMERYNRLRQQPQYRGLPTVRSKEALLMALKDWEAAHQEQCVRMRDDGQFFGFSEVAQGYLGRYTRLIFIPAVRDAVEEATEARGSAIGELMDLVVRSVLASREDIAQFREEAQKTYRGLMDPETLPQMAGLESSLTATLQTYCPEAEVALDWEAPTIDIRMPQARLTLLEDGYPCGVSRTGHGLQRALILTLLQHLALARTPSSATGQKAPTDDPGVEPDGAPLAPPSLLLCIEEPELYQHPNRQRHLASVFLDLAAGRIPGAVAETQVIYTTHSPLFIGIDRFDQVRLLRKTPGPAGHPKQTQASSVTLDHIARVLWEASGCPEPRFTRHTLFPRLQAIMTPQLNEGFFANVVVLVEGPDDRSVLLGTARAMGYKLESLGISVLPCMGRNNLDRPYVIFQEFGIPTYMIWDNDAGDVKAAPHNRYLLRLLGVPEEDYPSVVADSYAVLNGNLEKTMRSEIGPENYDRIMDTCMKGYAIEGEECDSKNPIVWESFVSEAAAKGRTSPTIRGIVEKILARKN